MAGGLKFRIKIEEELYYLCSENKGADQLRSYRVADQRLCFRICRKPAFSRRGSYIKMISDLIRVCKVCLHPLESFLVCKANLCKLKVVYSNIVDVLQYINFNSFTLQNIFNSKLSKKVTLTLSILLDAFNINKIYFQQINVTG